MPLHDDRRLFELLVLEAAQAGLSWLTVLRRREGYRRAFDGFDIAAVARYDEARADALLQDAGIIRNRQKVAATIQNAGAVLRVQEEFGSLDRYLWQFVGGVPIRNARASLAEIPATSPESVAMSKDLRKRGFAFVGPTICYAFMQASGMVNDHTTECFRYGEV